MEYGMSRLGRVNYRESGRGAFIPTGEMPAGTMHSEQTAHEIDREVKRIVDEGLQKARQILGARRATLVALSERLLEKEVMDADELREIVEATSPEPKIVPGTESLPAGPSKEDQRRVADDETHRAGGNP